MAENNPLPALSIKDLPQVCFLTSIPKAILSFIGKQRSKLQVFSRVHKANFHQKIQ